MRNTLQAAVFVVSTITALFVTERLDAQRPVPSPAAAVSGTRSPTYVLVVTDSGGLEYRGNGALVADDGTIVTERGLLAGARRIRLLRDETSEGLDLQVARDDPNTGLALVRSATRLSGPYTFSPRAPIAGDDVLVHAKGLDDATGPITMRIIEAKRFDGVELLVLSTPLDGLFNGAAVVDPSGALVGLAYSTVLEGEQRTVAIPARYIQQLLGGAGAPRVVASGSAPPDAAPTAAASTGPSRRYRFAGKEDDRVTLACQRSVLLHLVGEATTGDIRLACACVSRAFANVDASIPAQYTSSHFFSRDDGEVLNISAMESSSRAELVPPVVRAYADRLLWDTTVCLGTLPIRSQMAAQYPTSWRFGVNPEVPDMRRPAVSPVDGPPAEVDRSLGGLIFADEVELYSALRSLVLDRGPGTMEERTNAVQRDWEMLRPRAPDALEWLVLSCKYRTEAKNGYDRWQSTTPDFFWYEPAFSTQRLLAIGAMPENHPVHRIQAPRAQCPLRKSAS